MARCGYNILQREAHPEVGCRDRYEVISTVSPLQLLIFSAKKTYFNIYCSDAIIIHCRMRNVICRYRGQVSMNQNIFLKSKGRSQDIQKYQVKIQRDKALFNTQSVGQNISFLFFDLGRQVETQPVLVVEQPQAFARKCPCLDWTGFFSTPPGSPLLFGDLRFFSPNYCIQSIFIIAYSVL